MKFVGVACCGGCRELEEGIGEYLWSYFIVYKYEILKNREKKRKNSGRSHAAFRETEAVNGRNT